MNRLRQLGSVLVLALLVAWLLLLRPTALGGPASYIVVTGESMEPTLWDGDLVVMKKQDRYDTGEIVTYQIPAGDVGAGTLVIHRVTGGDEEGLITQGDNRDVPDDWRPTTDDVRGKLWFHIPGAGRALGKVRQPTTLAALGGGLTVFMLLLGSPKRREDDAPDGEPALESQDA